MWTRKLKRSGMAVGTIARNFRGTPLFLALILWVCTLPLIAIVAAPFLGWKMAAYIAAALLVADLVACRVLCAFRIPK